MTWKKTINKSISATKAVSFSRPTFDTEAVDWERVVTLDLETYFDDLYTLKKMSTSEYIRDERFKAQMVGIKIGRKPTKWYPAKKVRAAITAINWSTHSLLCHNTQFDGFILSHHYGVVPARYYDTLSMARGLHSNEIGFGLDEVAKFYGGEGKIDGILELTKGLLDWPKELVAHAGAYCAQDVDETFRIFTEMQPKFPKAEMDLVHITIRMFCDPVLRVDIPRVEKELEREVQRRRDTFYAVLDPSKHYEDKTVLKSRAERALTGEERDMLVFKRVFGSNEKFADMLRAEGAEPPVKLSPAWVKLPKEEKIKREDDKWAYAFAKDDLDFVNLPDNIDEWRGKLNPNKPADMTKIVAKSEALRRLVDCRIMTKSTTNVTRSERFLKAGANGWRLPVGYAYARAHTLRWGGNNKMNMQNLTRGGELRLSILADKGHRIAVVDSGQIEARTNGWLWDQHDLLDAFRKADTWDKSKGIARGQDRDAYCKFADSIYNREITTNDKLERFVGKVCIAEGELVLTDRGLVPINLISKQDRLWDGVEWVTHDGIVDQGIKEVITYDGLTATPDHQVFTEDGRIVSLGQAASEMARLQSTGAEGQAIWFCDDHVIADTPRKRLSVRQGEMFAQRSDEVSSIVEPRKRQDHIIPQERAQASPSCGGVGATVRRYFGAMYQSIAEVLEQLWRPRHSAPVLVTDGVYPVGDQEPTPRELCAGGDRPDRQRRALCAREFEAGYTNSAESEQAQHTYDFLARGFGADPRVRQPLEPDVHVQTIEGGNDWRANTRKVRTFDIANAGPRRRYTVSGKLCLNCVLGLGYQMGAAKLQMTLAKGALGGPPVYFTAEECTAIVNKYRTRNYKIKDGWAFCTRIIEEMAAGIQGAHKCISWEKEIIWLPNGLWLRYPDLKKGIDPETGYEQWTYASGEQRSKLYGGLLCENLVQALARLVIGEQMVAIDKFVRVVMTTHDEIVTHPKAREADAVFERMMTEMMRPPVWCSDMPLNAEGGHDVNYSK